MTAAAADLRSLPAPPLGDPHHRVAGVERPPSQGVEEERVGETAPPEAVPPPEDRLEASAPQVREVLPDLRYPAARRPEGASCPEAPSASEGQWGLRSF